MSYKPKTFEQKIAEIIYLACLLIVASTITWRFYMLYFDLSWMYNHTKQSWETLLNTSANPSFFVKYPQFGTLKFTFIIWLCVVFIICAVEALSLVFNIFLFFVCIFFFFCKRMYRCLLHFFF